MLVVDEDRLLVEVNQAFLTAFGRDRDALVGAHLYDLVADGPLATPAEWEDALAAGRFSGEADLLHEDGHKIPVEWAAAREATSDGALVLFVALGGARRGSLPGVGDHASDAGELTAREREVVTLVAHGHSNHEIAAELHVSMETVKSHMRNLMRKLHARSRAHVVAKAFTSGLIVG